MPSKIQLREIVLDDLVALRRNPQYLTEKQSAALQLSIETDGFLVPIIVRPRKLGKFEVLSGNHRVQAARSAGMRTVPCVVLTKCSDRSARRIALNMNNIHGDPPAELLAPFLAEMADDEVRSVYLDDALMQDLKSFDSLLAARLLDLQPPPALDSDSRSKPPNCVCPRCGKRHVADATKTLLSSQGEAAIIAASSGS